MDDNQSNAIEILKLVIPLLPYDVCLYNMRFVCRGLRSIASQIMCRNRIICTLLQIPPGEMQEAIDDMKKCIADKAQFLLNQALHTALPLFNTKYLIPMQSPNHSHKVLLSKYGEVGDAMYLDPVGKQLIRFNHYKNEVAGTRPITFELEERVEPFRFAFEREAQRYVEEYYPCGASTVYGKLLQKSCIITIAISSSKSSIHNFWGGHWTSVWKCTIPLDENSKNEAKADISGNMQVHTHYYEDGNVQSHINCSKKLQCEVSNPVSMAEYVLEQIRVMEGNFLISIRKQFEELNDTVFKAFRRALPMRRPRTDWSKIATYKLSNKLASER